MTRLNLSCAVPNYALDVLALWAGGGNPDCDVVALARKAKTVRDCARRW